MSDFGYMRRASVRQGLRALLRIAASTVFVASEAVFAAAGATQLAEPAQDNAALLEAVAAIARGGAIADVRRIGQMLKLDGMESRLEWTQPPSWDQLNGPTASFWADEASAIRNIFLRKHSRFAGATRDELSVILKGGACPSIAAAEAAFGMKFHITMMPHHHGELPPWPFISLRLTATDGREIAVSIDSDGCAIRMSGSSAP